VAALTGTLADAELLDPGLPGEALLYRLFHEDGVRANAAKMLLDRCRCTRERAANALRMLDEDELARSAIDGIVTVTCQFCNRHEHFDGKDLRALHAHAGAA
jgi:molecular chaperone Hsp33